MMTRRFARCAGAALAVVCGVALTAVPARAGSCGVLGEMPVASERSELLKRGFNFTNWRRHGTGAEALRTLRRRGFSHVRLPVDGEELMTVYSTGERIARYLTDIERTVRELLAMDYAVSIDMHPGGSFQALHARLPERGYQVLEEAWNVLAERLAGMPVERVFFELLNEPTPEAAVWWRQAERLSQSLRTAQPGRTLIAGTGVFQRIDALVQTQPLSDPNVVYAVHFYDPLVFTHQGLNWSPGDPLQHLAGVPFPAGAKDVTIVALAGELTRTGKQRAARALREGLQVRWDQALVDRVFDAAGKWLTQHKRPVIVNEFGVLKWQARPEHRLAWLSAVRQAAERNCIGWTHWDFADGFGLADETAGGVKLDPTALDALVPK